MKYLTFVLILFYCGISYSQEIETINIFCGNAFSEPLKGEEKNDVYEIPKTDILKMSAKELARLDHAMIIFALNTQGSFIRSPVPKSVCRDFINKKYLKNVS